MAEDFQEQIAEHVDEPVAKRRKTQTGYTGDLANGHDAGNAPDIHAAVPVTPGEFLWSASGLASSSSNSIFARSTRSRRRTSGPAFVQIAEDPEVDQRETRNQDAIVEDQDDNAVDGGQLQEAELDKENASPEILNVKGGSATAEKAKRKAKKRRSIGQQSGRRKKRWSNGSVQTVEVEPIRGNEVPANVGQDPEWETMIGDESAISLLEVVKPVDQSEPAQKKRRKRKSVVLKPKKRRRSTEIAQQNTLPFPEVVEQAGGNEAEVSEPNSAATKTPRTVHSRPRRRRVSDASAVQTPGYPPMHEPDAEEDETYIDEAISPEKPTPKPRKKGKSSRRSGSSMGIGTKRQIRPSPRVKKSSKSTFPIITHRLTNVAALPTIIEEAEDPDSANDSNSLKTKFPDRSDPNAIDVLAQICREAIKTTISKLSTTTTATSAKELRRKRTAIEAFGSELDSRLTDMSVAVEHRLTLETRVKKSRKEKADLQAQWIEVRRQREEIALNCDNVRARHNESEEGGKESYELSEKLYELEMVVERGEDDNDGVEALEFMLKSVAQRVSGAGGGSGGILDRVKEFNRQLETTAMVLEGSRVG